MLIKWRERLKQVAITMIIITPFLVELVCFRHSVNHYVELEKRANCNSFEFKVLT